MEQHNGWLPPVEVGLPITVEGYPWGTMNACDAWTSILANLSLGEIFQCPVEQCRLNAQATA